MKRFVVLALLILLASIPNGYATPQLINYQGFLTGNNNEPLDGSYAITVNIYDSSTSGTLLWGPQTFSSVPVVNGKFNLILGPQDQSSRNIDTAFTSDDVYLEVTVGTNPPVVPRQQILSTPYSLRADYATNAANATNATNATEASHAAEATHAASADHATTTDFTPQNLYSQYFEPPFGGTYVSFNVVEVPTWKTVIAVPVYIPKGATKIKMSAYGHTSRTGTTAVAKLRIGLLYVTNPSASVNMPVAAALFTGPTLNLIDANGNPVGPGLYILFVQLQGYHWTPSSYLEPYLKYYGFWCE